jgi:hypothetical protein
MYAGCNIARLQAGLTRVDAAPTVLVLPTLTPPVLTVTAPSSGSMAFTSTDAWNGEVGGALIIHTARPTGAGIEYFKGPYRYADKAAGAVSPPTSPKTFTLSFPCVAGQKINYKVRCVRADGRISGPLFLVSTAS